MPAVLLIKVISTLVTAAFVIVQVLFLPIAAFIHCVRNPSLTTGTKIAWACLIIFTWTLGASIYGIVASQRPLLKWLGILSLIILIPFMFARKPLATYVAKQQQAVVIRDLDKAHLIDLGEADRAILKSEIMNLDLSNDVSQDLIKLLSEMIRNESLERNQLMDWQHLYQSKDVMDATELKKYILKVQLHNLQSH